MELFANFNSVELKALQASLREDKLLFSYLLKIRDQYNDHLNEKDKKKLLDEVIRLYQKGPSTEEPIRFKGIQVQINLNFHGAELERLPSTIWFGKPWGSWYKLSTNIEVPIEEEHHLFDFERLIDCKVLETFFKLVGYKSNIFVNPESVIDSVTGKETEEYILQVPNLDWDLKKESFVKFLDRL